MNVLESNNICQWIDNRVCLVPVSNCHSTLDDKKNCFVSLHITSTFFLPSLSDKGQRWRRRISIMIRRWDIIQPPRKKNTSRILIVDKFSDWTVLFRLSQKYMHTHVSTGEKTCTHAHMVRKKWKTRIGFWRRKRRVFKHRSSFAQVNEWLLHLRESKENNTQTVDKWLTSTFANYLTNCNIGILSRFVQEICLTM